MFTGIVEKSLPVLEVADAAGLRRVTIENAWPDVGHGDSIAINGVCLTVARIDPPRLTFEAIPETLAKTNIGRLRAGDRVNVERAMRIGDRFDGHFVQGHVDGTAEVVAKTVDGNDWRLTLELPQTLAKYLTPKGSVTLDGVSLTIASIDPEDPRRFDVAIIPTTLQITTFGDLRVGQFINFEADTIAKTVLNFLELRERVPQISDRRI